MIHPEVKRFAEAYGGWSLHRQREGVARVLGIDVDDARDLLSGVIDPTAQQIRKVQTWMVEIESKLERMLPPPRSTSVAPVEEPGPTPRRVFDVNLARMLDERAKQGRAWVAAANERRARKAAQMPR